jgi:hypothetical protein
MKYFRITYSSDDNEIGFFPQVQAGTVPTTIDDFNFIGYLIFEEANSKTLIPKGHLNKRARKTDLISTSFPGFSGKLFVSAELNEILTATKSKGIQHLKTSLVLQDYSEEEYWIINPYLNSLEFIDFPKSEFVLMDRMLIHVLKEVHFENQEDFLEAYKQNRQDAIEKSYSDHKVLLFEKVAIKDDCNLDFFSLSPVRNSAICFFVSEKLKTTLEKARFTGITFKEMNT